MARIAGHYVYYLWDENGVINYVGKGQGQRMWGSAKEQGAFGGVIYKRNLDEQTALSMEATLIDHYGIDTLQNKKPNGASKMIIDKWPPRQHGTRKNKPLGIVPKPLRKDHYEKHKETLKQGVAKARRKREIWINEYLADKHCEYCGESETCSLVFYPNDKEIRKFSRETGLRKELRLRVLEKIRETKIVCMNCEAKKINDIELSPIS
jgi:hypothetical protein